MRTLLAALLLCASAFAQTPCEKLSALTLPDTTITSAQATGAESNAPALCRVKAVIKPTTDSNIEIEVWMPAENWNGKFQAVGNGGWSGAINRGGLSAAVSRGYASASTDTGHKSNAGDASWALGHPEKLIDFSYRSEHEMTVKAKAIISAFYGKGPRLSYWNGCSTGGKQGLKEAQRFPDDYDGIIAGAPANYWTHLMTAGIWVAHAVLKDKASYVPPPKFALINKAAIAACDDLDGVKDGLLEDPRRCHFDPATLLCTGEETDSCLTKPQVEAVKKIYSSVTNPRTGAAIFPGLEPGSELGWAGMAAGPEPFPISVNFYKNVLYGDPNWDYQTFDFDKAVALSDSEDPGSLNTIDPDLKAFKAHGGKLILYHGWNDQLIAPENSINYYQSVLNKMGTKQADFIRLFMAPGMAHCAGGRGPNHFDMVSALEQWVEKGIAPEKIIATHETQGTVDLARPLCPYPKVAHWTGSGSINDAANFTCVAPQR